MSRLYLIFGIVPISTKQTEIHVYIYMYRGTFHMTQHEYVYCYHIGGKVRLEDG
jgi:hypothetical protein